MSLEDEEPERPLELLFRCPKELEGLIPAPIPAAQGLPDWLKAMPGHMFSALAGLEDDTMKRCPPIVDAMTRGFLIPLICDVTVEDGQFTWDHDLPQGEAVDFARSPMGVHDPGQLSGSPLFEADRFVIKFHNLWTIQAPPGYSLLFTHPVNRFDLPFFTLTGLVDCDLFHDTWINFPAYWRDPAFNGVLPRGTPVAQCFLIKREAWTAETAALTEEDAAETRKLFGDIRREKGVYRRLYRA